MLHPTWVLICVHGRVEVVYPSHDVVRVLLLVYDYVAVVIRQPIGRHDHGT